MSIRKSYSVRDRDVEDHKRIEKLIQQKDKSLSEVIMRQLRQWERRVTK